MFAMHEVLSGENLDEMAEERLRKSKYSFVLKEPQALDIDGFAEFELGLTIDYAKLSPDESILGMSSFANQEIPVWSPSGYTPRKRFVSDKTVLLDIQFSDEASKEKRRRFTLSHECAHFELHRQFEDVRNMSDEDFALFCLRHNVSFSDKKSHGKSYREWQANRFGAALLMPKTTVCRCYKDVFEQSTPPNLLDELLPAEIYAGQVAKFFNVSNEAMKIRLKTLGLAL